MCLFAVRKVPFRDGLSKRAAENWRFVSLIGYAETSAERERSASRDAHGEAERFRIVHVEADTVT